MADQLASLRQGPPNTKERPSRGPNSRRRTMRRSVRGFSHSNNSRFFRNELLASPQDRFTLNPAHLGEGSIVNGNDIEQEEILRKGCLESGGRSPSSTHCLQLMPNYPTLEIGKTGHTSGAWGDHPGFHT